MSETGQNEKARQAVHEALKRLDEFHRDGDLKLVQVRCDGSWVRFGTFGSDEGTVRYNGQTRYWEVSFEDEEGPTGVVEQVQL